MRKYILIAAITLVLLGQFTLGARADALTYHCETTLAQTGRKDIKEQGPKTVVLDTGDMTAKVEGISHTFPVTKAPGNDYFSTDKKRDSGCKGDSCEADFSFFRLDDEGDRWMGKIIYGGVLDHEFLFGHCKLAG